MHACVYIYKIKNYMYKNLKRIGLAHALLKMFSVMHHSKYTTVVPLLQRLSLFFL